MEKKLKAEIGGRTLSIQTGKLAKQASGAVLIQYGETMVLVTVVSAQDERPGDFLPLTVEYQEKIYAAGRIPGNYFRREIGRPSEKETLTARLIDRPIRPLFPKGYRFETQVIATVLSMDKENDPDILAIVRSVHARGLPVGIICHGGSVAISAGIVGARATGSLGIKDDLVNAGGNWVDKEVVVDGHLVTSRTPDDLPAFMRAIIGVLGGD